MSLTEEERKAIVELKTEKAKETLIQAKGIVELGYLDCILFQQK